MEPAGGSQLLNTKDDEEDGGICAAFLIAGWSGARIWPLSIPKKFRQPNITTDFDLKFIAKGGLTHDVEPVYSTTTRGATCTGSLRWRRTRGPSSSDRPSLQQRPGRRRADAL